MSTPEDDGAAGTTAGTPRWVKVTAAVVAVLVVAVVVVLLVGGGHGPGRHLSPDDRPGSAPPGHQAPAGGHGS